MGLFNRKKEKPHILDRGLLAEAIDKKEKYPEDTISLNEHLTIKVESAWYSYDASWFGGFFIVIDYFMLKISTYVDDIKMADYEFQLDIKNNKELYRRWECKEKTIIHYMPNQFIDLINEWSKSIVSEFDEKRNKENKKKNMINKENMIVKRIF